jgi:protease I
MARIAMVVAPKDFRDEELFDTKRELEQAGHATTIVSKRVGTCRGMLGGEATAVQALDTVDAARFDAVVFVGGGGAEVYFDDPDALQFARDMATAGKLLGAICIAPVILANAGVLKGRRATVFHSETGAMRRHGVQLTGEPVTVDGRIVTAEGPKSARAFGRALVGELAEAGRPSLGS